MDASALPDRADTRPEGLMRSGFPWPADTILRGTGERPGELRRYQLRGIVRVLARHRHRACPGRSLQCLRAHELSFSSLARSRRMFFWILPVDVLGSSPNSKRL